MAKRIVIFEGRQPTQKVSLFFKKTKAEVIEMKTGVVDNQIYFIHLVEVDPKAFNKYIEKMPLN